MHRRNSGLLIPSPLKIGGKEKRMVKLTEKLAVQNDLINMAIYILFPARGAYTPSTKVWLIGSCPTMCPLGRGPVPPELFAASFQALPISTRSRKYLVAMEACFPHPPRGCCARWQLNFFPLSVVQRPHPLTRQNLIATAGRRGYTLRTQRCAFDRFRRY